MLSLISDEKGKLMLVTELAPLGALVQYLPKNKVGYRFTLKLSLLEQRNYITISMWFSLLKQIGTH